MGAMSSQMIGQRQQGRHSGRDVKLWLSSAPKSCGNVIGKLPFMALDTGIPAGMTALVEIFKRFGRG